MDFCREERKWKRLECPLLKTKTNGQIDVVVSMMLFMLLLVAVLFGFRITQYMVTAAGVEDALAASNLASAVIDLEEYGRSHLVYIPDAEEAFLIYREALCYNLELDEYLNTTNRAFLSSQVEIKQYIIYNVRSDIVEIMVLDGEGRLQSHTTGKAGEVFTPDNVRVETTTIYSKIGFWVEGLQGQEFYAEKEKSIDIMRCDSE